MPGIDETISDGLGRYLIGEKLRTLRLRKSMGLVELAKRTGLSAALLSKLERQKLFPTLPTLLRIAMVFGVGLDYFFTDERKRRVVEIVRRDERVRFPERPGVHDVQYYIESLDYRATERKHSGVSLCAQGSAGVEDWRRRICSGSRRRDLLRLCGAAQLLAKRFEAVYGSDRDGAVGTFLSRR